MDFFFFFEKLPSSFLQKLHNSTFHQLCQDVSLFKLSHLPYSELWSPHLKIYLTETLRIEFLKRAREEPETKYTLPCIG